MKSATNPDQALLERLLELINLLRPPGKTKRLLAQHFKCSIRTISRYEKTLIGAKFIIEKDKRNCLRLVEPLANNPTVHLSNEEVELIYELVQSAAPEHKLAGPLLSKLFFQTEHGYWVRHQFRSALPVVIKNLSEALRNNRQIRIRQYEAAITGQVRERILQPLDFTPNYNYLVAYEESEGLRVNLKIDRIQDVEILEAPCNVSPDVEVDIFHMAANQERYEISLLLTHLARRLLIEQLPDATKFITATDDEKFPFRFQTTIFSFLPVGRFYLGLPGHVMVEQPADFKTYLHGRMKDFIL